MGQWLLPSRIFPFYSQKEELTALTSQFPSETLSVSTIQSGKRDAVN